MYPSLTWRHPAAIRLRVMMVEVLGFSLGWEWRP